VIRVERHRQGPRLYIVGLRIHEVHLGLAIVAVTVLGAAARLWHYSFWTGAVVALGTYMAVKDARDLLPHTRDTGAWRLGLHRRFAPLRAMRYADLREFDRLAGLLGYDRSVNPLDLAVAPRGYRVLSRIPRLPEPVIRRVVGDLGSLDAVVRASQRELEAVEGVGGVRAREIREGLRRLQEHNLVDRYIQL